MMSARKCPDCASVPSSLPCPCGVCGEWRVMCSTDKRQCGNRIVVHGPSREDAEAKWNLCNGNGAHGSMGGKDGKR
jgi:hypothetical protein